MLERFEQFSSSIAELYHYIQKIERVEMTKYGLKGPHVKCLIAMHRYPEGITAAKLCELCDKDKAAISRTLSELEQHGLVNRCSVNGNSYRALLKLTPAGEEAAIQVAKKAQIAVERAGVGMTQQQREMFYTTLNLIASNLNKIFQEGLGDEE